MRIAGLIFAAGSSSRLGEPKQLIPWGEGNLLTHVIARTLSFGVEEVWVVLGHESERILAETDFENAHVVINDDYELGLSSSIRVGLDALTRQSKADSALLLMGDQPDVRSEVVHEILETGRSSKRPVVMPKYRYTWSNPALVDRSLWPRIMSIEGDHGASKLLQTHPEWVEEVWFEFLPPRDVDTPDDVAELSPK